MVELSCPSKFHSFALAEQLARFNHLTCFHTLYFSQINRFFSKFHHRLDLEEIPKHLVKTFPVYLPIYYLWKDNFRRSEFYDYLVSRRLKGSIDSQFFIGWSSFSFKSAVQAKKDGKIVIIERGSTHINFQNQILKEEYSRFGINFTIDPRIIEKELQEYELADFVSVPSKFVQSSFITEGFCQDKLFLNNYGSSKFFTVSTSQRRALKSSFKILYLGSLTIRKGLIYFFEAIKAFNLKVSSKLFEVWIIGSVAPEIKECLADFVQLNWKIFGHINHYELPNLLAQCDVAVQPSIEEGLSMVIPQLLSSGVPVIATTNTGAEDIIINGYNGFIVPIRDSPAISNHLLYLFENRTKLVEMCNNAHSLGVDEYSWENYGKRYSEFLVKLTTTD